MEMFCSLCFMLDSLYREASAVGADRWLSAVSLSFKSQGQAFDSTKPSPNSIREL